MATCFCRRRFTGKKALKSWFKTWENLKNYGETLKSLGLSSKQCNKSKSLLTKDGTVQIEPRENLNVFGKFYSEIATNLEKNLAIAPNKYCI